MLGIHELRAEIDGLKNEVEVCRNEITDLIKQNETVIEVSKYGLPKNCSKLLIDFYKEILKKYKSVIGIENDRD